jgi:hypothetical protein
MLVTDGKPGFSLATDETLHVLVHDFATDETQYLIVHVLTAAAQISQGPPSVLFGWAEKNQE